MEPLGANLQDRARQVGLHNEQISLLKSLDLAFSRFMREGRFGAAAQLGRHTPEDNYRRWQFVQQACAGAADNGEFPLALQILSAIPADKIERSRAQWKMCEGYAKHQKLPEAEALAPEIQNPVCQSYAYEAISKAYAEAGYLEQATEFAKKATKRDIQSDALQVIYPKYLEREEIDEALKICWELPVFEAVPCPNAAPDLFALDHKCKALVHVCGWLAEYGQVERAREECDKIPSDLHRTHAQELIDLKAGGRARQQAIEAALATKLN